MSEKVYSLGTPKSASALFDQSVPAGYTRGTSTRHPLLVSKARTGNCGKGSTFFVTPAYSPPIFSRMGEKAGRQKQFQRQAYNVFFTVKSVRKPYLLSKKSLSSTTSKGAGENKSKSTDRRCPKYNDKAVPPARQNDAIRGSASKFFSNPSVVPSTVSV